MPDNKTIKMHVKKAIGWVIIIYFLTVVSFYFSQIIPLKRQLRYLEKKTKGLELEVNQLKSEYAKKWEGKKEDIFRIIDSFKQKKGEKDIILSEFFKISQNSGVDIEKTEPREDEALGDTMIIYSWNISCRTDYAAIGTFFNKIERSQFFLCVESPSIQSEEKRQKQPKEKTPITEQVKHKAEFLLSTYRFKE